MPHATIAYLRACYEADNRRADVWNVFHRNFEHRHFLAHEDLLTGELPHTPLDPAVGQQVANEAYAARKEKTLIYASFLVVGRLPGDDGETVICAPLLLHRAEIVEQPPYVFLRIDPASRRINSAVLDRMLGGGTLSDDAQRSRIETLLQQERLAESESVGLAMVLEAAGLDGSALYEYPALLSEKAIRQRYRAAKKGEVEALAVVPASCMMLMRKSVETRGVLGELTELAQASSFSPPLRALLDVNAPSGAKRPPQPALVPATLSHAQQRVLQAAQHQDLTLVVGPPGTGKSFTIAALAMEHMGRGASVLVASKMDHAVDVVATKIEDQLGLEGCIVRGGRRQYLADLKRYLDQLLSGMYEAPDITPKVLRFWERKVEKLEANLADLGRDIDALSEKEVGWGQTLSDDSGGVWTKLRKRHAEWLSRHSPKLWTLVDQLIALQEQRNEAVQRLILLRYHHRLQAVMHHHRKELLTLHKALRARAGGRREDLFAELDLQVMLKAFPVWLVTVAEAYRVLPNVQEVFDLLIIDEATQCDMASVLPLFQRARRVVITGDPNQLRHISFLARQQQKALAEQHGVDPEAFDYREQSVLDLANDQIEDQQQIAFLDEHYRSVPAIIGFSNDVFYGSRLRIMTQRPIRRERSGLVVHQVGGTRDAEGVNAEEAERLVEAVVAQAREEASLDAAFCHSIGVLSPLRNQADYLAHQLAQRLTLEAFERHRIMIGTAHTFQGEERDVMYVSFALDNTAHPTTRRFINRADVFNVAVTRARVRQEIFVSTTWGDSVQDDLLARYLAYAERGPVHRAGSVLHANERFLLEVRHALEAEGYQTWTAYPVAGLTLDLVAAKEGRTFGIDLVGYPGAFEAVFPRERYQMFHRAGLRIIPVPYAKWIEDRDAVMQALVWRMEPDP